MNKKQIQQRVSQDGQPLSLDKFEWDEKTNTFSSDESNLVLDFNGINNCTFKTGSYCTFKTGFDCTFKTGFNCTFKTGFNCTFDTGSDCTFKTDSYCTFNTGSYCTFNTGSNCTFNTGSDCVIVRRDIYEIIEPEEDKKIKLNEYGIKGFYVDDEPDDEVEITVEGKTKRISRKSAEELNLL